MKFNKNENFIENFLKFMQSAKEATQIHNLATFNCPLCNSEAIATKSSVDGHIHAKCNNCKMSIMQ